jgi:hypothetical protein
MSVTSKFAFVALLLCAVVSCKKESKLSPREQQQLEEETAVLLPNEILEQEGIRFILNYNQESADIGLKLNKGIENTLSPLTLYQDQPFVNYSVLTNQLDENSEFTLQADFLQVGTTGSFDITVIGFTNLNTTKKFTITGLTFAPSSTGTAKSILRIKKGLKKYSFYSL